MTTTFYQYTKFLDRLKTIASPSWDEVDQVLSLIKDTPYFRYFFYDLNNPGWLPPLKDVGIFHNPPEPTEAEKGLFRIPPWEASRYLIRVAHVYPGLVAEIALQIETENFRVHQDLVQAAMRMPPAIAAQMMPPVIRWLDSRFKGLVPEYAGDLMVYLAEGGQWEAALRLLQALTEPTIEQPSEGENERLPRLARSQAQPRYDKYILEQILEKHIPQLARTHPLRVLAILEAQLIGAIELEQEVGQWRQSADGSIFWRSAIEDHPQNSGLREMKELLAEAIRDILQEVATDEHVRSVIKRYLTHQYSIFRRLAIHMVRLQPEHYQDLVGRLFGDRANLDDPNIHHEFYLLMGAAFDKAPPEVQEHLLQWIVEGEPPERLEQSKESYIDRTGEEPPEDLVRRWKENWTWTRLWALRNYDLPPKYRSELDRLVVELGEPEHPSFLMYSTSWVGPTGPKSKDELVTMTPAEVLKYLKGYTPSQEPFAPSPEGLGRVLQTVIQEKVEEYASCAPRFLEPGVQPAYMYYLLWGLEEAWKAGRSFDWEPVLTFCEDVVQRTDEEQEGQSRTSFETSYAAVHGQAATLLQEAVRRDDHAIPQEHMLRVRDILLRLLHHPDPTPEHEQQYGGDNMDPATLSLNTVRGKAMHALI
ncbi:MAG: hypothetical protein H8D43_04910, partial [Chloroflexi bacterium]|nr:hypothetical protein [Chloroflexota bacterium]